MPNATHTHHIDPSTSQTQALHREGKSRPREVVIGAGFAGLTAAHQLRSAPMDVLVLDRHNYDGFWLQP